jgi:hypothetical protein
MRYLFRISADLADYQTNNVLDLNLGGILLEFRSYCWMPCYSFVHDRGQVERLGVCDECCLYISLLLCS